MQRIAVLPKPVLCTKRPNLTVLFYYVKRPASSSHLHLTLPFTEENNFQSPKHAIFSVLMGVAISWWCHAQFYLWFIYCNIQALKWGIICFCILPRRWSKKAKCQIETQALYFISVSIVWVKWFKDLLHYIA